MDIAGLKDIFDYGSDGIVAESVSPTSWNRLRESFLKRMFYQFLA